MADFACLLVANVMLGNVSTFRVENLWPKTKTNTFLMNGLLKLIGRQAFSIKESHI